MGILGLFSCAPKYVSLRVNDFAEKISNPDVVVIDVRTAEEYKEGYLSGAVNIDWLSGHLPEQVMAQLPNRDQKLALYCRSGRRSKAASEALGNLGYKYIFELEGGYLAWQKAGMPTVKQKK